MCAQWVLQSVQVTGISTQGSDSVNNRACSPSSKQPYNTPIIQEITGMLNQQMQYISNAQMYLVQCQIYTQKDLY